jgi:hypothetical protein
MHRYYGTEIKWTVPAFPQALELVSHLLLGCRSRHQVLQVRARYIHMQNLCSVFILEHYFISKLFAAVWEAFSSGYRDTEKVTIFMSPVILLILCSLSCVLNVTPCILVMGFYT